MIRVFIGYAPGGSADAGIRPLAKVLEPILGQPLIIENKPGAAGGVAMELVAKAPADGYTLYYFDSGPLTVAPHLGKVGYTQASFTQLGHVCGSGSMLVVHPSTPFKTVNDVIAASKADPAKWSYGTSGVGGPHHLSGEYFKSVTGASLLHVPYKGGGPAMTDLIGGQIPMLFSSLGPVVGAAKSGRVRPIAVRAPPLTTPQPPRNRPGPPLSAMMACSLVTTGVSLSWASTDCTARPTPKIGEVADDPSRSARPPQPPAIQSYHMK